MNISISAPPDCGNIELIHASEDGKIRLRIRPDCETGFMQWFYFRVSGVRGRNLVFEIENASEASYGKGYEGYQAVASSDLETWSRIRTEFDGTMLRIFDEGMADDVRWYAYFAPYPISRHEELLASCQQDDRVTIETLTHTLDGYPLDCLHVGEGSHAMWLVARQHAGETMAEWWMEGFLERLLDPEDASAVQLLKHATVHIVPNMNPDGSRRGHLRGNAKGVDLNREWDKATLERSPEVFAVRKKMHETGVALCLDVHGDEELPYNFIAGAEGTPSFGETQQAELAQFKRRLCELTPVFQTEFGYAPSKPGEANLGMCTNYTAETFGALSMTLEQPFKDTANHPHPEVGWSPGRAKEFGATCLEALLDFAKRERSTHS